MVSFLGRGRRSSHTPPLSQVKNALKAVFRGRHFEERWLLSFSSNFRGPLSQRSSFNGHQWLF